MSCSTKLEQSFAQKTKLSWADDVKPALGPELDVVVLPAAANGSPSSSGSTQPDDGAKLDALLAEARRKPREDVRHRQVGGWTAVADSQAALDAVSGATAHARGQQHVPGRDREARRRRARARLRERHRGAAAARLAAGRVTALPTHASAAKRAQLAVGLGRASSRRETAALEARRLRAHARAASAPAARRTPSTLVVDEIPGGRAARRRLRGRAERVRARPSKLPQPLRAPRRARRPSSLDAIARRRDRVLRPARRADPGGHARDAAGRHAGRGGRARQGVSPRLGSRGAAGSGWARSLGSVHALPRDRSAASSSSRRRSRGSRTSRAAARSSPPTGVQGGDAAASDAGRDDGLRLRRTSRTSLPLVEGLAALAGAKLPAGAPGRSRPAALGRSPTRRRTATSRASRFSSQIQ